MKATKSFSIFLLLFFISISGFSQIIDMEAQMFGTRSLNAFVYDLNKLEDATRIEKTIGFVNAEYSDLTLGDVNVDEGTGILLLNKKLKNGEKGKLILILYPSLLQKGAFQKEIKITFNRIDMKGIQTKLTQTIVFKGVKDF